MVISYGSGLVDFIMIALVFFALLLSPVYYCSYWEYSKASKHGWFWIVLMILYTFVNIWFIITPTLASVSAWAIFIYGGAILFAICSK